MDSLSLVEYLVTPSLLDQQLRESPIIWVRILRDPGFTQRTLRVYRSFYRDVKQFRKLNLQLTARS
jgi:hypothetical protein